MRKNVAYDNNDVDEETKDAEDRPRRKREGRALFYHYYLRQQPWQWPRALKVQASLINMATATINFLGQENADQNTTPQERKGEPKAVRDGEGDSRSEKRVSMREGRKGVRRRERKGG